MDIIIRSALAFVFIYAVTRLIGRRELSSLEPFDLILLIVIGDITQQGITQSDHSFTGLVLSVGVFALMTVLVAYLGYRFRRLRPILEGTPLIIVEDGKVVERVARAERITKAEIEAEARLQKLESLDRVRWGVLETNGKISFIEK